MLVSHFKRFIYLKTPKTAGTSVEIALEPYCAPPGHTPSHTTESHVSKYGIIGRRGPKNQDEVYYNHMPAEELRGLIGKDRWAAYQKCCNIRNPFDLTVSYFYFVVDDDLRHEISTRGFEFARRNFRNWLASRHSLPTGQSNYCIAGKPALDFYIRYEALADDLKNFSTLIGIDSPTVGKFKTKKRMFKHVAFKDYYDERAADCVRQMFGRYFEWFGYDPESWK